MIYLIGGSSHVGKTLLAQKLLEAHRIPYLSLDHLKMGLIRTHMTSLTVNDDYKMRFFLFPLAAEMIKTAIENDQSLIVEGCYIPSQWKDYFDASYLDKIRAVFLVMSEAYLRGNFAAVGDYANVIEQRKDDELDLERLIQCSREFREESTQYHNACLEIDESYDISAIQAEAERLLGMEAEA